MVSLARRCKCRKHSPRAGTLPYRMLRNRRLRRKRSLSDNRSTIAQLDKEARMSVLVTMRVNVHDFEGTKQAVAKYGDAMLKAGCHWFKVYQRDGDDKEVLWL